MASRESDIFYILFCHTPVSFHLCLYLDFYFSLSPLSHSLSLLSAPPLPEVDEVDSSREHALTGKAAQVNRDGIKRERTRLRTGERKEIK